jgi:hypothetical protein
MERGRNEKLLILEKKQMTAEIQMCIQNGGPRVIKISVHRNILCSSTHLPPVATVDTGIPVLWDIKPSTENTTKPAKILVPQFTVGTNMESLELAQKKA